MTGTFAHRMADAKVRHDTALVGDFTGIYCKGHHADRRRRPAATDAASLGVYGAHPPVVCEECEAHLAYAEKRRAYCAKDPKPFCAHCDTHCYAAPESEWQCVMMRYSGPRSWAHGYLIDGLKHMRDTRRARTEHARRQAAGMQGVAGSESADA